MKILILNWRDTKNPKSGGAEIVTFKHARAWVKKGHEIIWFTSQFENSKKEEKIEGISIVRRGNFMTIYLFAPFFYLFSGNKFDLVVDEIHGLSFFTPLYVRKPKIVLIHEVASEIWDYMFPFPVSFFGKLIEPLYFKLYKHIQFWTDAESTVEDLIKRGIERKNCTVINCPANNKSLDRPPAKEKIPTFVFVSRVVKMKGIEDVIRAFFYILRELKDAKLWIVGDGDKNYVRELKDTMVSYSIAPRVKFLGRVDEARKLEYMRRAHVILHASVKEGWGLVIIEAASQATPAVVYDVAGLRDSVKNGRTGIVVSQNSSKEMAKQAVKLFKNKVMYEKFQINCLGWVKSLTWEKATAQSLKLIENVAKNR